MLRHRTDFVGTDGGAIAVEFALFAPVLLLLFFGSFELSRAMDCRTRVVDAASTVADLVAQNSDTTIDDTSAQTILCAAKGVLYPYSTGGAIALRITSIICSTYDTANAKCTSMGVGWSRYTSTLSRRTTVPSDLSGAMFPSASTSIIMVEMTYVYTSPTTEVLGSTITMSKSSYTVSRTGSAIPGTFGTIADCSLS